jgi:hypothetical protein
MAEPDVVIRRLSQQLRECRERPTQINRRLAAIVQFMYAHEPERYGSEVRELVLLLRQALPNLTLADAFRNG